jgi:hypothetical protein
VADTKERAYAVTTISSICALPWRFGTNRDPILKERLFGLTNSEGNHGEDVKEYYFYLDCTPALSMDRAQEPTS